MNLPTLFLASILLAGGGGPTGYVATDAAGNVVAEHLATAQLVGGGPQRATQPTVVVADGRVLVSYYGGGQVFLAHLPLALLELGSGHAVHRVGSALNLDHLNDEPLVLLEHPDTTPPGEKPRVALLWSSRYGPSFPHQGFTVPSSLMTCSQRFFDLATLDWIGPESSTFPDFQNPVPTTWLPHGCGAPPCDELPDGGFYIVGTGGSGSGENAIGRGVTRDGQLLELELLSPGLSSSQNYPDASYLDDGSRLVVYRHTGVPDGPDIVGLDRADGLRWIAGAPALLREPRLTAGPRGWVETHVHQPEGGLRRARAVLIHPNGRRAGLAFELFGDSPAPTRIDPRAAWVDAGRWVACSQGIDGDRFWADWRLWEGASPVTATTPMFPGLADQATGAALWRDQGANPEATRSTACAFVYGDRLVFAASGARAPGGMVRVELSVWRLVSAPGPV